MKELYDYQKTGRDFLAARARAYLGDGPGLGKTIQAAVAAKMVKPKNTLIIAPASAVPNWEREWGVWGPTCDLEIMSFEKTVSETKKKLWRYDLVVIDEVHYCKTRTAQRTKAALTLAKIADRSWLLSGTPMPSHPGELWAPIYALWPG